MRGHVDFLIDNGLHGLVPCGSTGEFAALTLDERKRVNEIVVDQAAERVPVAPQTGSTRTADAVELSKHAAAAGADALMVVQPSRPPLGGTATWSRRRVQLRVTPSRPTQQTNRTRLAHDLDEVAPSRIGGCAQLSGASG